MNDFQTRNKFGGGEKGDRRGGNSGKRDFNRSHFGGDRAVELFSATCAGCGVACQVPFRPNGKKPVYCKACFDRNNGGDERPSYRSEAPRAPQGSELQEIKRNIDALHAKVDAIMKKLG